MPRCQGSRVEKALPFQSSPALLQCTPIQRGSHRTHLSMQTVNFNCPHCGNLMAVGTNLLGRNVRCPHCRLVVRAPAAAGEPSMPTPAAPPPTPAPPPQPPAAPQKVPMFSMPQPTEHHESIFGERHDEDVFGSEPPKPVLPSEPQPLPEQLAQTVTANEVLIPPPPAPPPLPIS